MILLKGKSLPETLDVLAESLLPSSSSETTDIADHMVMAVDRSGPIARVSYGIQLTRDGFCLFPEVTYGVIHQDLTEFGKTPFKIGDSKVSDRVLVRPGDQQPYALDPTVIVTGSGIILAKALIPENPDPTNVPFEDYDDVPRSAKAYCFEGVDPHQQGITSMAVELSPHRTSPHSMLRGKFRVSGILYPGQPIVSEHGGVLGMVIESCPHYHPSFSVAMNVKGMTRDMASWNETLVGKVSNQNFKTYEVSGFPKPEPVKPFVVDNYGRC